MSTYLMSGNPEITDDIELTIGIPSYKRTDKLKEAIDSVFAQKNKNIKFKLLISEDDTENHERIKEIIESYHDERIVYYRNVPALGMSENWNQCFRLAKTKYVALLHDDDYLKDNYLDVVEELFSQKKVHFDVVSFDHDLSVNGRVAKPVYGRVKKLYNNMQNDRFHKVKRGDYFFGNLANKLVPSCGTLYDRQKMVAGGGYFPSDGYSADVRFCERCCRERDIYFLKKNVAVYRCWDEHLSSQREVKLAFVTEGVKHRMTMTGIYGMLASFLGRDTLKYATCKPYFHSFFPEDVVTRKMKVKAGIYNVLCHVYIYTRSLMIGIFGRRL